MEILSLSFSLSQIIRYLNRDLQAQTFYKSFFLEQTIECDMIHLWPVNRFDRKVSGDILRNLEQFKHGASCVYLFSTL